MSFRFRALRLPLAALSASLGLVCLSAQSAQALPFFGKKPEAGTKAPSAKGAPRGQTPRNSLVEAPSPQAATAEQSARAKPATAKERQAARSLDMINQASFWLGEL